MVKAKKCRKKRKIPKYDIDEIENLLKNISFMDILIQDAKLNKISEKYDLSKAALKKKLSEIINEKKTEEKEKAEKEKKETSDVNVNKNITTPSLPTTTYYIKSWGYYEKGIVIEQVNPSIFLYFIDNKRGIAKLRSFYEEDDGRLRFVGRGFDVGSKRFMLSGKKCYDANLFYNVPTLTKCYEWLDFKIRPRSYDKIQADIKKLLKEMYDFGKDEDISVSTLMIAQSWIKPMLDNFFFYGIDSSLGGGKTTLGEIVFMLMRHGFVGGNISPPSIPRLTNELDLNIYIDEIDQNTKDDDTMAIMRKGQRRGNPYVRCEGRDNTPTPYDVAGCHGFSFRSEIEDAFRSRTLSVHTSKTKNHMLPVINTYKKEILKPLADELFFWYMENIDRLVVGCSREERCSRHFKAQASQPSCSFFSLSRGKMYEELTSHLSDGEREYLKKVFGRDNELVFLSLQTAKTLGFDILIELKTIMLNKVQDEASTENFYLDAIRNFLFLSWAGTDDYPKLTEGHTLQDGSNVGCYFFPKNRLYEHFIRHLNGLKVATIGTKKYNSLLRDLGFVEGISIKSERYDLYPSSCLIFTKEVCENIGIQWVGIKKEPEKIGGPQ